MIHLHPIWNTSITQSANKRFGMTIEVINKVGSIHIVCSVCTVSGALRITRPGAQGEFDLICSVHQICNHDIIMYVTVLSSFLSIFQLIFRVGLQKNKKTPLAASREIKGFERTWFSNECKARITLFNTIA